MNGLSWLLYAAEVSERVTFAAGGIAFFGGIGLVLTVGGGSLARLVAAIDGEEIQPAALKLMASAARWNVLVFFVALALAWLPPSKNTLMLIAASEIGETVLASKDVQAIGGEAGALASDSLKLLRKYVTEQLGEAAK